MQPLISVVIPTYNHAHFLSRAIQSVLDQTYSQWEAIIVDNHSEDNTAEVIGRFADPRIKHLLIHNHGVIAASRNRGIKEAKGEWIAFLDSDDYWYPGKLASVMELIQKEDLYDVVSTDEILVNINSGKKRMLRYGPFEKDFYRAMILTGNRLSPSATLVRAGFLKAHGLLFSESKEYITVEDYDLWLNLALVDARFKFIHEVQGEYLIHSGNNSAQMERHNKNCFTLLHDHVFKIQQFDPSPMHLWKKVLPRLQLLQVGQLVAGKQKMKACKLVLRALLSNPVNTTLFLLKKLKTILNK